MKCTVYCTAESYRLKDLAKIFPDYSPYIHQNDVLALSPFQGGDLFFTFFGCIIFWNVPVEQHSQIIEQTRACASAPLTVEFEEFKVEINPKSKGVAIDGTIYIPSRNQKTLLVISYALAQATRLNSFERTLDTLVHEVKQIPSELARDGKSRIKDKTLLKLLGRTFLLSSSMSLQSDILDTPELLWSEDNEQIQAYKLIRKKTEIEQRANLIDRRLLIIQSVCSMLHGHTHNQRSLRLEIAIVALIAIEIFGLFTPHIF